MPPNWLKFKSIVNDMITNTMGAESCTISTPGNIIYDTEHGEIESEPTVIPIDLALIPTNKDDLKDLPEGLRDKATRKIYTTDGIPSNATITTLFDGNEYEIIVPSVPFTAGGQTHCYRTFIGKIETHNGGRQQ